ncbi:MAG: hypothetical protein CUN55_12025 [Phototrophicales bacterium]|nr:MAG: hypothetical protein CUN55_12025 [Phototrophicales bacterium]
MQLDKDKVLTTIQHVVQEWRTHENNNFAVLADMLRRAEVPERIVGVVILNLMTAEKALSDTAVIQNLRNQSQIWGEESAPLVHPVGRKLSVRRDKEKVPLKQQEKQEDVWAKSYTRWNQRYIEAGDEWALGAEPSPEVVRAVEAFRAVHSIGSALALDLGAGDGRNTLYLAQQGFEVIAVDAAPVGIEKIKRRLADAGLSAHTVLADLREYELPPSVDLLVASYVIHLLPNPYDFLRQWQQHTRVGGFCVVSSRGRLPFDSPEAWFLEPFELRHIFQYAGWHIVYHQEIEDYHSEYERLFRRTAVVAQKRDS